MSIVFSHLSRATTGGKAWKTKCVARAKLLFWLDEPITYLTFSLQPPPSLLKLPNLYKEYATT